MIAEQTYQTFVEKLLKNVFDDVNSHVEKVLLQDSFQHYKCRKEMEKTLRGTLNKDYEYTLLLIK